MNLNDFEKSVENKIVSRGYDYFKNGDVRKIEKVSDNEYSATVFGSNIYTVFVKLDSERIAEYECDCPYDYGNTCKHAVAVFYKLRAKDFTDSAVKFKAILDGVNDAALRVFAVIF